MANRDFDPFASAVRCMQSPSHEFLTQLAKAKLDEFFLQVVFSRSFLFFPIFSNPAFFIALI
jgi:hypothetical protein